MWDSAKAAQNVAKHGVGFGEAATVFDDPAVQAFPDDVHSWDEHRLIATGLSAAGRLLTVSYALRGEVTRLISTWPAIPNAVRRYSHGNDH